MTGLPAANRKAKTDWHPVLKSNLEALRANISGQCGLPTLLSWRHNITTKDLTNMPLWDQGLLASSAPLPRVMTIHQVKGESIDAVMYVLRPRDVKNVLAGPVHEEGRIAYVGLTRARDFLVVAIPDTTAPPVIAQFRSSGLADWA